ncbi:ornithine decarboxylase [Litorimonas taeanensis]|uniref:ornithine decarboxylase n=1 Tax=Litorimonas taeanensis TaxID=568099 RepID=A0A420WLU1_9PROT|nr:type III PLP-dependent enzyme [Litorimonas taeanensis]RKQ71998.1 ornithine decarboxylase [Litorimonas taeanensis]
MIVSTSAVHTQQPIALQPYGLPTYKTSADAIAAYNGDDQIYALYPRKIEAAARLFVSEFPGHVLYAVKSNPHPSLLQILWNEGVSRYDVASMREIDLVRGLLPRAELYLMHPVKSRRTIAHAYTNGVRNMSFDHEDELQKILDCTNQAQDLHLHLRLALPKVSKQLGAVMPLGGKFGAGFDEAVALLKSARPDVQKLGLCFHVGSQCLNIENYNSALTYARTVIDAAGVKIDSIDVGGGFPVSYPDMPIAPMAEYFGAISASVAANGFAELELFGEPGRALCAEGGATLVRVELRKDNDLYLNDGTYGSLFDAGQFSWKFPVRLHRSRPPAPCANTIGFRFFGPTCDSADTMNGPFHLPADTCEGDWIEIQNLGAYGQTLATQFNGFYSHHTVAILED